MYKVIKGERYMVVNSLPPNSYESTLQPTIAGDMGDHTVDVLDLCHRLKTLAGTSKTPGSNPQIVGYIDKFLQSRPTGSLMKDSLQLVKVLGNGKSAATASLGYLVTERLEVLLGKFPDRGVYDENTARQALNFSISMRHQQWCERLVTLYGLKNLPKAEVVDSIKFLLAKNDYMGAAFLVSSLNYHNEFTIRDIAVPLMIQDRTNILETYLKGSKDTAQKFISFLDSCTKNMQELTLITSEVSDVKFEKINPKTIAKLVKRLVKMLEIDPVVCPNVGFSANFGTLKFIVRRRYGEGNLENRVWTEMVTKTVGKDEKLQEELLHLLVEQNDILEAKRWAEVFELPHEKLPFFLRQPPPELPASKCDEFSPSPSCHKNESIEKEVDLPGLDLDLETDWEHHIHFVHTESRLNEIIDEITNYNVIALDSEWKPSISAFEKENNKVALVQIATWDDIYLVDVVNLRESPQWIDFFERIMSNPRIMVLGYAIHNDVRELKHSFNHIKFQPKNVVDVGCLSDFILPHLNIVRKNPLPESKGLAKLVASLLGKYLKKDQQFSNWEIRPLSPDQIKYAAMDVLAVLQIYEQLSFLCEQREFDFRELLEAHKSGKKVNPNLFKVEKDAADPNDSVQFQRSSIITFKCVVDNMLQGLGHKLRLIGADVHIIGNECRHDEALRIAERDQRIILSTGKSYEKLKQFVPIGNCFKVRSGSSEEQLILVLKRFNLIVKSENLLSRCMKCNNNNYIVTDMITLKKWEKEMKTLDNGCPIQYSLVPSGKEVEKLYICSECGHVYWSGSHYSRLLEKLAAIIPIDDQKPMEID